MNISLKWVLKTIIIWIIGIWVISIWYNIYNIFKINENFQIKNSDFTKVDKETFNSALYNKAFTIDNDLVKYLSKKMLLINCDSCSKYLKKEEIKFNIPKELKELEKYNKENIENMFKCQQWFWVETNLKDNTKEQKKTKLEPTGSWDKTWNKNIELDGIKYCKDYLKSFTEKKQTYNYYTLNDIIIYNIIKKELGSNNDTLDLTTKELWYKNWLEYMDKKVLQDYCSDKLIFSRNINLEKNNLLKQIICWKDYTNDKGIKLYTQLDNGIFLKDPILLRRAILFLNIFWNETVTKLKLDHIVSNNNLLINKYYQVEIKSKSKRKKRGRKTKSKKNNSINTVKIYKWLLDKYWKKELFTNCYLTTISNKIQEVSWENINWSINNLNILKNYSKKWIWEMICITTSYDKKKLVFNKEFSSFLFPVKDKEEIKKEHVLVFNHILNNIVNLENLYIK